MGIPNRAQDKPIAVRTYAIIITALLALGAVAGLVADPGPYDWVFVYFMSYDNNLAVHANPILAQIGQGMISPKVAVVVLQDLPDTRGLRRITLRRRLGMVWRQDLKLATEDSADVRVYDDCLQYVRRSCKAKNYVIVFLNHGGRLNSMCRDDRPFADQPPVASGKWLDAMEMGTICARFQADVGQKVRLLFLQQCGRASLQNLYSFVDTAQYILASPVVVGAPNTYYAALLRHVAGRPNTQPVELARVIMDHDRHYTIYTLVDNGPLRLLPEHLEPLLAAVKQTGYHPVLASTAGIFSTGGETNVDLEAFIADLRSCAHPGAFPAIDRFQKWINLDLVACKSYRNPSQDKPSGLSVHIPQDRAELERYTHLPIYQDTGLNDFFACPITATSSRPTQRVIDSGSP